jgi:GT2 family glycosyltransferase/tetratricopeptide (TPR) repeat protein
MRLCAAICVHTDDQILEATLKSLRQVPKFVFVSSVDWQGVRHDVSETKRIAESQGATVIEGDWPDETSHRRSAYKHLRDGGWNYCLTIDSDEIIEPSLLEKLISISESGAADRVHVEWDTYWKSPEYVIRPREPFKPCVLINLQTVSHVHIREFAGGTALLLTAEHGIIHHFSYAGGDERIWKKITTWSHRDEIVPDWWNSVWKAFDRNPLLRNLHPTHPSAYQFAEHKLLPIEIAEILGLDLAEVAREQSTGDVGVVIPTFNGQEQLNDCLKSLIRSEVRPREIIVVDNGSQPLIEVPTGVQLIRSEVNLGFAKASNLGAAECSSKYVLFLNDDTVVANTALGRLIQTVEESAGIAAVGPVSNNCGHFQRIVVTYTSLDNLGMFADQLSCLEPQVQETDMLVGFCLLVKREVLEQVGPFDESFGIGMFEDNDLSYRIRRSGYRMLICRSAFVHHIGSQTFAAVDPTHGATQKLLQTNQAKFRSKWSEDIASGFATHLSGTAPGRIAFDPSRNPDKRLELARRKAKSAKISLCMIVKNEERVLADCLRSATPFFNEVLVLDTGSEDRTKEIATSFGASVSEFAWCNDFSAARTASMQNASGDWVMWLDADDTLPLESGEVIQEAVLNASPDVLGFVVPVQFVEQDGVGTSVDHVKVFRNLPGLTWEGRIHEQILPSLRRRAAELGLPHQSIVRLPARVLHTGYDTSAEGQARKRDRDDTLLKLDLTDRPDHPFVLFNLGMTEHFHGNHEAAVSWLTRCIEVSPVQESHVRKAYALMIGSLIRLELNDEAMSALEEALLHFDADPELHFLYGQFLAARGDDIGAIAQYDKAISSDASGHFSSFDPSIQGYKALHNKALSLQRLGKEQEASDAWKRAFEHSQKGEILEAIHNCALRLGSLNEVRLANLNAGAVSNRTALTLAVNTLKAAGLDPSVYLTGLLTLDRSNGDALKMLAIALMEQGQAEKAVPYLMQLDKDGQPEGAYFLGILAQDGGNIPVAKQWLRRALELNPEHLPTQERLLQLGPATLI